MTDEEKHKELVECLQEIVDGECVGWTEFGVYYFRDNRHSRRYFPAGLRGCAGT